MSAVKVISGFVCAAVIFAVLGIDYFILKNHLAYSLFFLVLLALSAVEINRIAGVKNVWSITLSAIAVVTLALSRPFTTHFTKDFNLVVWVLLIAGITLPVLLNSRLRSRVDLRDMAVPVFAAAYIGCFGAYLFLIFVQAELFAFSHSVLLWFICTTKANDILGYLLGSSIGKRQLNSVSPKKTVEGAVAGLIGGVLMSLLVVSLFLSNHFYWYHAVLFGTIVGVAAQLGDLSESLIKRLCGVKDSGNFIPGSGGALDFIDCFLFAAPVAYYFLLFTA